MNYPSGQDETGLMKPRYSRYIPNHCLCVMFRQTVLNPQVLSDLSAGVWWHFYSLFVVFKVQTTCSLVERWWLLSVLWKERWCALIWRDKRGMESFGTCRLNRDERGPLEKQVWNPSRQTGIYIHIKTGQRLRPKSPLQSGVHSLLNWRNDTFLSRLS